MADVDVPISFLVADSGEAAWSRSRHAAVEAAIAASVDADAVWFPGAHHDVHAQRPDDVTAALLALAARARTDSRNADV
jgi:pimeloyl-ACP methyl ester carboxylesterase